MPFGPIVEVQFAIRHRTGACQDEGMAVDVLTETVIAMPCEQVATFAGDPTNAPGHTRMTLRNRGEPTGFASVVGRAMAAAMRRANTKDLARLKQLLESDGVSAS